MDWNGDVAVKGVHRSSATAASTWRTASRCQSPVRGEDEDEGSLLRFGKKTKRYDSVACWAEPVGCGPLAGSPFFYFFFFLFSISLLWINLIDFKSVLGNDFESGTIFIEFRMLPRLVSCIYNVFICTSIWNNLDICESVN
jgi:hypothetical protein